MQILDFLSPSPSLYLLKEKRGKNKLGSVFSLLFILAMIALSIYHFYIYSSELDFNLTFYRDTWYTSMSEEQKESINKPKSISFGITSNPNKAKISLFLKDYYDEFIPAEKCKINPDPDLFIDEVYCFDLTFNSLNEESKKGNNSLFLICEENCKDPDGEPALITVSMMSDMLKIDHKNKTPLNAKGENAQQLHLITSDNIQFQYHSIFTPILYNTTEKMNTKMKSYFDVQFTSIQHEINFGNNTVVIKGKSRLSSEVSGSLFAGFYIDINNYADIYIREYRTFLDTLSKIGGLFSPIKLLFELLIYFYSDLEINSEIVKNVFTKIKNYELKHLNIEMEQNIQKKINLNIKNEYEQVNIENTDENQNKLIFDISKKNKEIRKKFKINKGEQYFYSFFNYCCYRCHFCRTNRTLKILNSCSDFVETYLSAENIIFNTILFENYYKNIKYNNNSYLKKIDKDIGGNILEDENNDEDEINDNDKNENFVSLNSDE